MPTLEVDFVSDWFSTAFAASTDSTVAFNSTLAAYGAAYDSKGSLQGRPLQHIGLLEAELPAGATIDGVRFSGFRYAASGVDVTFRGGLIARDGDWDVNGFDDTTHPTHNDIPFPVTRPASTYVYTDSLWHDGSDGYVEGTHATATSGRYTVGEGGSPDYSHAGWVSQLQSFLDETTDTHRSYSASGTAVPLLWCMTGGTPPNRDHIQRYRALEWSTASERPRLEIDYSMPEGALEATAAIVAATSSRATATARTSGSSSTQAAAESRPTVDPVASGAGEVTSATRSRGSLAP